MRAIVLTGLLSVLLATPVTLAAQAVTYYADNKSGSDTNSCTEASTVGTTGVVKPKQTVKGALDCLAASPTQVEAIVLLCTIPGTDGYCDFDLSPQDGWSPGFPGSTFARHLRGEPTRTARITRRYGTSGACKTPPTICNKSSIRFEDNWVVRGIVFDGDASNVQEMNQGGTFIVLNGDNILFTENEVRNSPYGCLRAGEKKDASENRVGQSTGITISHNHVHHCISGFPTRDRSCVFTEDSRNLRVMFNEVHACHSDGFATENYVPDAIDPSKTPPDNLLHPQYSTVAWNTQVVGNRFWTECISNPAGVSLPKLSYGENAIDIKRTGQGLLVQDNAMWGFRKTYDASVDCHGTGTGAEGSAIVIHGQFDNAIGGGNLCTAFPCAIVEGNDIGDSQAGIALGSNGSFPATVQGRTYGVLVRGNTIHDLRGVGGTGATGQLVKRIGMGMKMLTQGPVTPGTTAPYNRFVRNTFANLPGGLAEVEGTADRFETRYNLFSWTGTITPCAEMPASANHTKNFWYLAPTIASDNDDPFGVVFRSTLVHASHPGATCGTLNSSVSPPDAYKGLTYDYRLDPATTSAQNLKDKGPNAAADGQPHTLVTQHCDQKFDIGADEFCADKQKIFLREGPGSADQEIFDDDGEGVVWWESPDIGIRSTTTPNLVDATGNLWLEVPAFKKIGPAYQLLLRIRSNGTPITDPVKVRMWGAPFHTSVIFPMSFTKFVEGDVNWNAPVGTTGTAMDQNDNPITWKLEQRVGSTERIYSFAWKVTGAQGHPKYLAFGQEHFCLRAEVSTTGDWRPPFFTPVYRSNNWAQRNVAIVREPAQVASFLVAMLPKVSPVLQILNETRPGREVYLYVPKSAADVWADDGSESFPPKDGRLFPLKRGSSELRLNLQGSDTRPIQILIDSRRLGPPQPSEVIALREQGAGGVKIMLGWPGFHESFEWGFPRGWRATGLWRVTDQYLEKPHCGRARLGRKAAAFNSIRAGCSYTAGGPARGELLSPPLRVPDAALGARLSFWQWAEVDSVTGVDIRRLWIVADGKRVLAGEWTGIGAAQGDGWTQQQVDLSRYRGATVRLVFEFERRSTGESKGLKRGRGWYIDDIAVEGVDGSAPRAP